MSTPMDRETFIERTVDWINRTLVPPDVTIDDRISFMEYAVAWQVRRALGAGRFDLAIQLHGSGSHINEFVALLGAREIAAFHRPADGLPGAC